MSLLNSVAIVILICSLLTSCDSDINEVELVEVPVPRDVNEVDYTLTESGLKLFDFSVGPGTIADFDLVVEIHYIMWLEQDSTLITSSYISGSGLPVVSELGSGDFIPGMEEGIVGMGVGGDRQIVIPPFLAFGAEGAPEAGIPSNATLIVEVALLAVGIPNTPTQRSASP